MGLQAQLPLRMGQAVLHREPGVLLTLGPVHRLQAQAREVQALEQAGVSVFLREDELELITTDQFQRRTCLRADAYPVQPLRGVLGAVSLNRHLEPGRMQSPDRSLVKLQERLTAGAHHEPAGTRLRLPGPGSGDRAGQVRGGGEPAPTRPVSAGEIGVAELAYRTGAVFLPAGPQVATGEPAEHRRSASMRAFTLEGVEDLLDPVGHPARPGAGMSAGSSRPTSANPRRRS